MKNRIDINDINKKYGALLQDLDFMMCFGACERFLPYTKKEIETALMTQALIASEKNDKKTVETMIMCYQDLARFLPYDEYNINKIAYVT